MGETVDIGMAFGMILIFASFGLLAAEAWRRQPPRAGPRKGGARGVLASGYVYGPVSALAYATGYLARKAGLIAMPDPNFGTMVGAAAGAVAFVVAALFLTSYRAAIRSTFARWNPWLFSAAVMSSCGQILQFVALNYSTISRVALLNSTEVVFTIVLSRWFLRNYERTTPASLTAALLSVGGAALVIGW